MENILKTKDIINKVLIINQEYETNKYMVQRIKKLASTVTTNERITK